MTDWLRCYNYRRLPPHLASVVNMRWTRDIEAYLAERNANPKPYKWKAKGGEILCKITRARAALDRAEAA